MSMEDWPVLVFEGKELRVMPELASGSVDEGNLCRCRFCYAWTGSFDNRPKCAPLMKAAEDVGFDCDPYPEKDKAVVYVAPEEFPQYQIEFIRRRIGR